MRAAEVEIRALTKGKIELTAMEMESVRNLTHLRIYAERITGMLCNTVVCD